MTHTWSFWEEWALRDLALVATVTAEDAAVVCFEGTVSCGPDVPQRQALPCTGLRLGRGMGLGIGGGLS